MKARHTLTLAVGAALALGVPVAQATHFDDLNTSAGKKTQSAALSAASLRALRAEYQALVRYYKTHGATSIGPGTLGPAYMGNGVYPDDRLTGVRGPEPVG
jgi:hypothetical protein